MLVWELQFIGEISNLTFACHLPPSGLRILAIVSPTAAGLSTLSELTSVRAVHAVLCHGINDSPTEISDFIKSAIHANASSKVLERIQLCTRRLPRLTRESIELLFEFPENFRTADDLARAGARSRRSFDRELKAAGLKPSRLMRSARLIRAVSCLRMTGNQKLAMARAGYGNQTTLHRDIRKVFDNDSIATVLSNSAESLVVRVVSYCVAGQSPAALREKERERERARART